MIEWEPDGFYTVESIDAADSLNQALQLPPGTRFDYLSYEGSIVSGTVTGVDRDTSLPIVDINEARCNGSTFGAKGLFLGSFSDGSQTEIEESCVVPDSELAIMRKRDGSMVGIAGPVGSVAIQLWPYR